ncbi:hypothetical protein ACSYAY_01220 [Leptospirillum ferriphilum]|uniref:Uncharacterized protein n=1 Tax=Leptospirillum ferriphilum TaxID=178606 RepID=A0A1V3SWA8_9BACT|nr:hypothetical protein [Leptospirillum ferriphilum]OOH72777.1 hypothetical protein BOX24_05155 [Leptospirillum ferriphilum]
MTGMRRQSGGLFLPVAGMAVLVVLAWFLSHQSSSSSPPSRPEKGPSAPKHDSPVPQAVHASPPPIPSYTAGGQGLDAGWRILYRDNWEYKCPVFGHHVVDPEEACFLIAAPARLGPIVIRGPEVSYEKPFTVTHDPSVRLVKFRDPVMSLPEYVGPRFSGERLLCIHYPGRWMVTHRPVIDPRGRLIRYDPEQVRIFCGGGK